MCEGLWVSTPTVTLAGTSAILSAAIGLLCWMELVVGSRARGHYCDGALTSLLSGHCSLGAVFLRWSLTSRRQIKTRARSLYSEVSTLRQQPPPGSSQYSNERFPGLSGVDGSQAGHNFVENHRTLAMQ